MDTATPAHLVATAAQITSTVINAPMVPSLQICLAALLAKIVLVDVPNVLQFILVKYAGKTTVSAIAVARQQLPH